MARIVVALGGNALLKRDEAIICALADVLAAVRGEKGTTVQSGRERPASGAI
jgi:carbamate kinase